MTKSGYKKKFIRVFLTLTILVFIFFGVADANGISKEYWLFGIFWVAMWTFVPSALITLVWEFFDEKKPV